MHADSVILYASIPRLARRMRDCACYVAPKYWESVLIRDVLLFGLMIVLARGSTWYDVAGLSRHEPDWKKLNVLFGIGILRVG